MNAQRCAVMEFKAGAGISQSDVDGISSIFNTYFRPAGYTMVERTQIDEAISELRFQRSSMTEYQMCRVGEFLNVSKIVIGNVNVVMGTYNVDVRVINVETGIEAAKDGDRFTAETYRSTMKKMAERLASQIAVTPGSTVMPGGNSTAASSRTRTKVEVLYGYLKIFPNELGTFQSEPTSVIAQINKQAQHGYNNWRIPTDEELSLLRANNYLGSGQYMSSMNSSGIVLLVTDGKDYATLQAEAKDSLERRAAELKAQGFVDLGLPSGTLWRDRNEDEYSYSNSGGFYSSGRDGWYGYASKGKEFDGHPVPTKAQFEELIYSCQWSWTGSGYDVTGSNGNSIYLPAEGYLYYREIRSAGEIGYYWSSSYKKNGRSKCYLNFNSGSVEVICDWFKDDEARFPVRTVEKLVQD